MGKLQLGKLQHKVSFYRDATVINAQTGEQELEVQTIKENRWGSVKYIGSPSAGSSEEELNDQRTGKIKIEVVCRFFTGLRFEDWIQYEGGRFRIYSIQTLGRNEGYSLRAELRDDDSPALPTGAILDGSAQVPAATLTPLVDLTAEDIATLDHITYDPVSDKLIADRAIETTLNSLFLGEVHKMSSGAENIFFTNLGSDINFYPMWGGLRDQSLAANQGSYGYIPPSGRVYTDMFSLPLGGDPDPVHTLPYAGPNFFAVSIAGLGITTVAGQEVAPTQHLEYRLSVNGLQVYVQQLKDYGQIYPGDQIEWFFDHPVEIHAGTTIYAEIRVIDTATDTDLGQMLVKRGQTPNADGSYRYQAVVHNRLFEDKDLEFISPFLKYDELDFGLDATEASVLLRDLSQSAGEQFLKSEPVNTLEAVASGTNIQIKAKDGKKIIAESLPVSGVSIDGTLVNSVLNLALTQLNDLFTATTSFRSGGGGGNPVTGFALNNNDLTLTLQDATSFTVDVTTLGVDENKFVQTARLTGTDLELTMNDNSVLTADLGTLDDIDTDTVVSSGTVSGTDVILTLSDSSTVTIDLSSFSGGASSGTSVASGAVVGTDLVLTMDDASTVTIDAQNMVNGSQLPARNSGWHIAYGNNSGDAITTARVANSVRSQQPFYAGETLARGEEFIWNHDTNGTYSLGVWSGAQSTYGDVDVFTDSNWAFKYNFVAGNNQRVAELSHNVTVGTLYSSGYSIDSTTVLALNFELDGHVALYDITNGGRVLVGRTTIAQTGNSLSVFMGGSNQPDAVFPIMTKRIERWTMLHDELGTQNGQWTNGVLDHTILKANTGIQVGEKYMINLDHFGRGHKFGLGYGGAATGVANAEDIMTDGFEYATNESLRNFGSNDLTFDTSATNVSGGQYDNGGDAGMISVRYVASGDVQLWSEDDGEKIADYNTPPTDDTLFLHFGAEEDIATGLVYTIPDYSIQTMGQGSQPVVSFAPDISDQVIEVTEGQSLNAQIALDTGSDIVNQYGETDAPSWAVLNQSTGVFVGTAPAYVGTPGSDDYVVNCKAANVLGGVTNFTVTLRVLEQTYTNTTSLKFANGVNSWLGGNAALNTSMTRTGQGGSNGSDAWTLSMWVKDTLGNSSGQTLFYFGNQDTTNGGHIEARLISTNGNKRIRLRYGSSNNMIQLQTPNASTHFPTNQWNHVMITYDGNTTGSSSGSIGTYYSRFKIFINGTQMTTNNSHSNYGYTGSITANNFRFGRYASGNYPKDVVLNQMAIWDSDQSSNIVGIYNGGATQDLTSLTTVDGTMNTAYLPPAHYYEVENSTSTISDINGSAHLVGYNFSNSDIVTDAP